VLQKRLSKTGKSWTLGKYAMASLGVFVVVGALAWIKLRNPLLALLAGMAIGLFGPHMAVGSLIKKRIKNFNSKFPDAIELMVRGLRSGLPISETMGIVSTEVSDPVGTEFRGVVDRVRIGKTLDASLDDAAERIGTPEFQFFCITLSIQRETGGNLAETLSNLADVLRKRAQMKLKINAMSSESKASAYIIGSLPFIVFGLIFYIAPDYMGKFLTDERLIIAGLGGMVWMSIGAFIMSQMINFEI
jgi:tight adherence protein B